MESQATLVDPVVYQQSLSKALLYFGVDNVHNTTIYPARPCTGTTFSRYVVESSKDVHHTKITRVSAGEEPVIVGLIKRSDVAPDKVKLGENQSVRMSGWLKMKRSSVL